MRTRIAGALIAALALAASMCGQTSIPRMPDGRPDLNGLLNGGLSSQDITRNLLPGEQIVLTPGADGLTKDN